MVTTMSEEIQQLIKNLRQRKKAEMVEGELAAPRETSPSYTDLLARLLRAERLDKKGKKITSTHQARSPARAVDFGVLPLQAATPDFAPPNP